MVGLVSDDEYDDVEDELLAALEIAVEDLSRGKRRNDDEVAESCRIAIRRRVKKMFDKKPVITTSVVRVD